MYKDALRAAWAEINITNLDFNIKQIKEKVGSGVKITGVVKADAYGHGSVRVATVLRANGIESFAVATLSEAVRLRKAGFLLEEIMVLSPIPEPYIDTIIEHRLSPVVCDYKNAEAISKAAAAAGIIIKGYIAVDTGMGRIGYSDDVTSVEDVKMIAGLSNAVNLTDGLDGLAGGTSMIAMLAMAAMAFLHGDVNLSIFCTACAGACLGFLWFNCYPASIFMGDTGSLALGAAFACTSIMTNTEVVSLIIGGLFIVETLSVMIQVVYFHFTHKRVFLMAPIHHHFEKKGWAETKVVIRFWIIAAAFGAVGLALFFQLG